MEIQPLLDVCCKVVANMLKDKTTEQIRSEYHIDNDLSPEEEEKV